MNRVVMTGKKETFAAKILMKKLNDAGIECIFVPLGVNSLHAKLEYTVLFVLLIEDGDEPEDDVLQFLSDKTVDQEKHMMVIGSANELEYVSQRVRADRIYRTFVRPVDNNVFVSTVRELFDKVSSGEFRKSLLVVDDDPAFLALVRDWLRDSYNVTGVSSGMQAIKWLGRNKADLVLLDYEMPVTTGPQVFEMLRSDEDTKDIPIIFLTGKSDRESVLAVLSLKPDGYFLKDIRKKELCDRLAEFFVLRGGK